MDLLQLLHEHGPGSDEIAFVHIPVYTIDEAYPNDEDLRTIKAYYGASIHIVKDLRIDGLYIDVWDSGCLWVQRMYRMSDTLLPLNINYKMSDVH